MQIIAHRGYWLKAEEKNNLIAFRRAFEAGYGIETDIRDFNGELVISHNIAYEKCPLLEEVFSLYKGYGLSSKLALNIKADGLQDKLKELLNTYQIANYFLFDMSIPELVVNNSKNLTFYTRESDIENEGVMYQNAAGVWLDSFFKQDWLTAEIIRHHYERHKNTCIVSSELHGWDYTAMWSMILNLDTDIKNGIALCTDFPNIAEQFFRK